MTYRLVLGATGVNRVSRCEGRTRLALLSDYGYKMLRRSHRDDGILESLVIGAGNADPQEPLAAFVADIRFVVDGPVPAPTPALAAVLGAGFSAEGPELPAATPRRTGRRRLRMVAEAGIGLTMAAAGLTVAGAAGALPGAVQEAVASAVAAVSPFEFPGQPNEEVDKAIPDDRGIDGESIAEDAAREGAVAGIQNPAGSRTGLDRTADTPAAVPADVSTTATTADEYRPVDTTTRRPGAAPTGDPGSTTRRRP